MAWPVLFGVAAAMATGLIVGLWASVVQAPPEVAGAVASGVGGALGCIAFASTFVVKLLRRGFAPTLRRVRIA